MYQKFIGIDIGKEEIFVAINGESSVNSYPNTATGFEKLLNQQGSSFANSLTVLETTGGYEMPLVRFLQSHAFSVHRANTRKVKNFMRSYGQLGKSDSIDALGLALYAAERHQSLGLFVEHGESKLLSLINRRTDLIQIRTQEKNRLQAPEQEALKSSFECIINALNAEIDNIEKAMAHICKEDETYQERIDVLTTISGVGEKTALQLIALMPELGHINRKQIASLGGLAPHPNESGKKVGYRFVRGGRVQVKAALYMSAMSASRSHSDLGVAYKKFIGLGKKKKVALTAVMRKILVIANARMRDYYSQKTMSNSQLSQTA